MVRVVLAVLIGWYSLVACPLFIFLFVLFVKYAVRHFEELALEWYLGHKIVNAVD
jgi:hypothetical protein